MIKPDRVLGIVKKQGYEIRKEEYCGESVGIPDGKCIVMESAYTPSGDYLGNPENAKYLIEKLGISPEKSSPDHTVCSIGWSEKDQKWYGWSHRAIYGFYIGCKVEEGDIIAEDFPIGFEAETKEDCRKMAVAFAREVS
ncbi:MAG: hypothetical protein GX465_17325 [Acidobacteria bacterium]|mgnify:CR=1 FL=1|nr:hypothetical protein [Acidobacteriota bacterium]HPO57048.1 hypothetical protein [Ignavibacteriaceae bacterium]